MAAQIARRHLPDGSKLPFDRHVPLLDTGRVVIGVDRAKCAIGDVYGIRVRENRMRIPAHEVAVGIVEPSRRIE